MLVGADYSQVELRILAHLCGGVGGFADAFSAGADVHSETAAGSLRGPGRRRSTASSGPSPRPSTSALSTARAPSVSPSSSGSRAARRTRYIKRFKKRFPEIEEYRERTLAGAAETGYVETLLGRKRPVPDLRSGNFNARAAAERVAINTPVQGSAADLIKKAMLAVDARLRAEFPGQLLLLQVHDELLLEVDEDQAEAVGEMVREEMIGAIELSVPLVVDLGVGRNWDEAH